MFWHWVELFFFGYFCFVTGYSLFFSVAAFFYRLPAKKIIPKTASQLAVFIPSYKEDAVIIGVARKALQQNFSSQNYDVIIIADSLKPETLYALRSMPVKVHEVHFQKSTKVKSLQSALNAYSGYDGAVILDADNVMDPDFLSKVNDCLSFGWQAIQGQRTAKNQNNKLAILDGLSEKIANHINRQGASSIGLSCPLIGSAMAFNYDLLKSLYANIDPSSVAEDKDLQYMLMDNGIKIHYVKDAIVYDEKVDNKEVFKNQRKRWLSSHYKYLIRYMGKSIAALWQGKFSLFNIFVLFPIQLPRVMNLGILTIISFAALAVGQWFSFSFMWWVLLLFFYVLSLAMSVPFSNYNRSFFLALLALPQTFVSVVTIHFKLRGASKKFIHTPHKPH